MSEQIDSPTTRKVWTNTNGTKLLTVNGLLDEDGEYDIEKDKDGDETTLVFTKR